MQKTLYYKECNNYTTSWIIRVSTLHIFYLQKKSWNLLGNKVIARRESNILENLSSEELGLKARQNVKMF